MVLLELTPLLLFLRFMYNFLYIYIHLIKSLKDDGYRRILAGISLPNNKSVIFHEKLGFKKVGQLEKVGFKFKKWIDVGYWELEI